MNSQSWTQRSGLSHLWHIVCRRPATRLAAILRQGGPWAMRETERQRQAMEAAAAVLPPLPTPEPDTPIRLHLLTGRRFWYQTAFCLHSFAQAAGEPVAAEIYDDGTIDNETAGLLRRLGPAIRVCAQKDIVARLDRCLPAARYPTLRERWRNYPNIRKLTDVHAGRDSWKLVIDSDLLFFRRPDFLVDWLRAPERPLHAVDCVESYGYSRPLMSRLAGASIPPLVNVGLCGLRGETINWDALEAWCSELIAREGHSYYLEQALVAMLVAGRTSAVAPAGDYVTLPSRTEALKPRAVMHHYVAESKRWYFQKSWLQVPR